MSEPQGESADLSPWVWRTAALLGVVAAVLIVIPLLGEVRESAPLVGDTVLHTGLVEDAAGAIAAGRDPTDFWFERVALGYPMFHHYQHLPHVVLAYAAHAFGLDARALVAWTTWFLLALLPLSIGWTTARLTRDRIAGGLAALIACAVSTSRAYGLDLSSFGWAGVGLMTQLWGAVLLGPAWVTLRRAIRQGRGVAWAGALTGVLVLTHTVLGWVAAVTAVAFVPARTWRDVGRRVLRLGGAGAVALAVSAYFVLSFWLDRGAMNRSVHEKAFKYDAYGAAVTLKELARGALFDWDLAATVDGDPGVRAVPVVTILLGLGLVIAAVTVVRRRRVPPALWLFAGWLLLYFGRVTWGAALRVLPMAEDLHFHRLLVPVHLAGFALGAAGLAAGWRFVGGRFRASIALPVLAVGTAVLFAVPVRERVAYAGKRVALHETLRRAHRDDGGDLARAFDRVRNGLAGRGYAGLPTNWGLRYTVGTPAFASMTTAGIPNVGFLYHAMSLNADAQVYFNEIRPAHYNLFNVRYVVAPVRRDGLAREDRLLADDAGFRRFARPLAQHGRHGVFEVRTTGYFDLVEVPSAYRGDRSEWFPAIRAWINSPHVEAKWHPALFIDREPPPEFTRVEPLDVAEERFRVRPPPRRRLGRLDGETVNGASYATRVDIERPCFLMLKQTFHPGWRVTIDGRPAEPVMVAPAFVAVPITPGARTAVFAYHPPTWRRTVLIVGMLLAAVAVFAERWRRKRTSARRATARGKAQRHPKGP